MLVLSLLALAIALIGIIFVSSGRSIRSADTITVTGTAKKQVVADFIVWRGSMATEGLDMQKTYTDSKTNFERLHRFFYENGVVETAITMLPLQSITLHQQGAGGTATGKVIGYRYTQNFEIRSNEVRRIEMLSKNLTELISEGIRIESFAPEYLVTKLNEYRDELFTVATQDAKFRAEKIAEEVGKKVGKMQSVKTDVFQVTRRDSTEISERGKYDTSTFEKELMAVVSASFSFV